MEKRLLAKELLVLARSLVGAGAVDPFKVVKDAMEKAIKQLESDREVLADKAEANNEQSASEKVWEEFDAAAKKVAATLAATQKLYKKYGLA